MELLVNIQDLQALNIRGSYQREPHTQPPICTKPWQLTISYFTQIRKETLHIYLGVGGSGCEWCLWRELSVKEWIYVSV